jgi:CHASE1-domain containing sensor protein
MNAVYAVLIAVLFVAMFVWGTVDIKQNAKRADQARWEAEVIAHADEQHRWVQEDDPRGTFGNYPPEDL